MLGPHEVPPGPRLLARPGAGLASRHLHSCRGTGRAHRARRHREGCKTLGGSRMTTSANTAIRPQAAAQTDFDVYRVRADFPILAREIHGKPLVYLDNAATTQKPQAVIDLLIP